MAFGRNEIAESKAKRKFSPANNGNESPCGWVKFAVAARDARVRLRRDPDPRIYAHEQQQYSTMPESFVKRSVW